ncbi:MAG: SMI1/KNR4 family protein [Kofleriaceae bacterium]|nr:SMI1/KNR4 family protein [Myxococcales bacterium]MCB9562066.1 SMI1/KNR4 family protein [Kofleriaceae bacterium]
MTPETIARLDELFASMPVLLGGARSREEVDDAQERVGVRFDPDYREFLVRYGGGIVGSLPILGVSRAEAMSKDEWSVVAVTARFRADGWTPTERWVVVSVDLAGNPVGVDSEGTVWISDHDAGEVRVVATTFEGFIVQLLDE